MKKLFLLLLLLPLFGYGQTPAINVDATGNITIGAAINLVNGATITNDETDTLFLTEANISLSGTMKFTNYTHHIDIDASSATVGSTAPTATTAGTFRGLGFNADAEVVFFAIDIPGDWTGDTDMTLVVHWYPTAGDAVANGETVKWDVTYRSISVGQAVDNGTAVTTTATFTGGGAEIDKQHYETSIVIDFDNANQPITAGDDIGIQFDRDVSGDTYSGSGIVYRWDLEYTSNKLPEN